MKSIFIKKILLTSILLISLFSVCSAVPPIPAQFYGSVMIDSAPAPVGTIINATIGGVEKGSYITEFEGYYGGPGIYDSKLSVIADENDIAGGLPQISFLINGMETGQKATFEPGSSSQLDISSGNANQIFYPSPEPVVTSQIVPDITSLPESDNFTRPKENNYERVPAQVSYGLDSNRTFNSDDGLARLEFEKGTMIFTQTGKYLQQISIKGKNIKDLPDLNISGLKYTGYAYEVLPEETYFNPKGSLVFTLPPDKWYDIINAGPVIYEYIPQINSWQPVKTTSNVFTGEISGEVYDTASFAVLIPEISLKDNNMSTETKQTVSAVSQVTDNYSAIMTVAPVLPVINEPVDSTNPINETEIETLITSIVTPDITPEPVITEDGNISAQNTVQDRTPFIKTPAGVGFIVLILIVIGNLIIWQVYRRWIVRKERL